MEKETMVSTTSLPSITSIVLRPGQKRPCHGPHGLQSPLWSSSPAVFLLPTSREGVMGPKGHPHPESRPPARPRSRHLGAWNSLLKDTALASRAYMQPFPMSILLKARHIAGVGTPRPGGGYLWVSVDEAWICRLGVKYV